ncbi:MAG: EAL domain-containing protein [Proteobacteria bacterium]|nr:EAL domain-containing protein [Pseudomonadota bacterium]
MLARVLFVEDVETDAELAVRRLRTEGVPCEYKRVETEQQYLDALHSGGYDIILSDFSLPQFDGMSALALAKRELPDVPFIFLSGTIGEERAIEALRCGAVDYVLKSNLKRLAPAVTRALREAEQQRERTAQQARIARLTRILEMLSGINTAVVRIRDRLELLHEACRIAVTTGHYVTALVSFIEPGTRTARPHTWAGEADEQMESRVFVIAASAEEDSSVTGRVLRTGEVFLCNDIARADRIVSRFPSLRDAQFQAIVALPLTVDGTIVGTLTLTAQDRDSITDEELNLLREVAANLSFALQYFEKESAVQFLSYFDSLTGLAKRVLFCERLASRLTARKAEEPQPAVAIIDIEHLSIINDSYGRHAGDHLLRLIADRLRSRLNTESLAYLGAGCFGMLLENADGQDDALRELQQHIVAMFDKPFRIEAHDVPVTVKSGLACRGPGGQDAEALVQNAEAGLRQAKLAGEQYHHHRLDLSSKLAARLALEHRLRGALENDRYLLYYQPKIDIASGELDGVEALLRWDDPERGIVSPGEFLPILESTGMIVSVGEWALHHAAAQCQRWKAAGLRPIHVAVNCSPLQLRRPGFAELVRDIVQGWSGDGWGLDLEITESLLIDPESDEVRKLRALRGAGVRVAIDDFGTGYSSLSRLSDLPVDTLKIDRCFINGLPGDRASSRLVPTVISLARAFDMTTVAEGVETRAQLNFLQQAGCIQSQGFLHAQPMPAAALEALLAPKH